MTERRKLANMRLIGAFQEVVLTLAVLRDWGWLWSSVKTYEPLEEPGQVAYFIEDVTMPVDIPDESIEEQ